MNTLLRTFAIVIGLFIGISSASAAYYDTINDQFVFEASDQSAPSSTTVRSSLPDEIGSDEFWAEMSQGG